MSTRFCLATHAPCSSSVTVPHSVACCPRCGRWQLLWQAVRLAERQPWTAELELLTDGWIYRCVQSLKIGQMEFRDIWNGEDSSTFVRLVTKSVNRCWLQGFGGLRRSLTSLLSGLQARVWCLGTKERRKLRQVQPTGVSRHHSGKGGWGEGGWWPPPGVVGVAGARALLRVHGVGGWVL